MRAVINFYLTWKCNFTCAHCIHECGPQGNHMTLEQIEYGFRVVHWLKENNIPVCVFGTTGGEATLHPLFWSEFLPRLKTARETHQCRNVELHTNGSTPVSPSSRREWFKFFSDIYIGHDQCHRQFNSVKDLYLQEWSELSYDLHLRFNNYTVGPFPNCLSIRDKGRTHESLVSGRLIEVPCQNTPRKECIWYGPGAAGDGINICFTPDHINHCGEKSHPRKEEDSEFPEGQFHPYGMDYDALVLAATSYRYKYAGPKCSQPCWIKFARFP